MNSPHFNPEPQLNQPHPVAVIGGGPAGLMAAEVLSSMGHAVHVYDSMPSVGRKFLLAGRGGLNLTHAEAMPAFGARYSAGAAELAPMLSAFDNMAVQKWAGDLGVPTFVGSSHRVFPMGMKASPLLRAWLRRLQQPAQGVPVRFFVKHRWVGMSGTDWLFETPEGVQLRRFNAVVLALGGGSWSRLGSDAAWTTLVAKQGVAVTPLKPSNCGFDVVHPWSTHFRTRHAGRPLKSVNLSVASGENSDAPLLFSRKGECVITDTGLEGSLVYAASSLLRDQLAEQGGTCVRFDLLPDHAFERVLREVSTPRGSRSLSTHLKSKLGLEGVKMGLLYELLTPAQLNDPLALAGAIKALPLKLGSPRPLDEAISTAGGVAWHALDSRGMLSHWPGVFCAGEMLDWDAPTGGYLLTACLASGRWAGMGAHLHLTGQAKV
jgi:uncharacterized flavoprotein (TIGR03862 family)